MDFAKNNYYQEKFTGVVLSGAALKEVTFEECQFKHCSFVDCKFEKCRLLNCKIDGCILSAADIVNSRFVDIAFTNSKVIGVDWVRAQYIREISFESCQVNYSSFRLLKLPKIKMVACEAKEADFTETDLTEGIFIGTDFERSLFSKSILIGANFTGAKNYFIDARINAIKKAHFSLPEALSLISALGVVLE
jgi:fluoroquinolone resistance protein